MTLRVHDTLSGEKKPFQPVREGKVGMYVCGPTVYKLSHVGHMVGPVIFDTVKRYLTYLGYEVTFVVNVTDIDDKIIAEAQRQNRDWKELAECVTEDYLQNLKKLGVTSIDHFPRATEHVGEIIRIIAGLVERGYAYPAGGDVYFDISKDEDYGKLCNRDPEQLQAGARIEVSERKRNPGDFALWKSAKPGEPSWDSPWGPGRPGWHIECSAMSMRLLGQTLDIHGGGLDLQFPHHENELAQSESYTGRPFANYWMHNGLMKTGQEKMSKSKGNEIVVTEVLKRHDPDTVRLLLVGTHYRSPIEYSEERLAELKRSLESFYRFFERYQRVTGESFYDLKVPVRLEDSPSKSLPESSPWRQSFWSFLEHMDDDFNTGGAVGVLYELLRSLNRFADATLREEDTHDRSALESFEMGALVLKELTMILGLFREPQELPPGKIVMAVGLARGTSRASAHSSTVSPNPSPALIAEEQKRVADLLQLFSDLQLKDRLPRETQRGSGDLIQLLVELRNEARKSKNFALGDQIRTRLKELNVTLEDRPGGKTDWRLG